MFNGGYKLFNEFSTKRGPDHKKRRRYGLLLRVSIHSPLNLGQELPPKFLSFSREKLLFSLRNPGID